MSRQTPERRRAAHDAGHRAEILAAIVLRLAGYRVLTRRYLVNGGEIDIVAARGDTIAFVEVKARKTLDAALEAITPAKRRRMSRAARVWLAGNPWAATKTLRGDALFIAPWRWPRHVVAAFELDLG